eukprot:TRINITY_DN17265_c0_g1_i1.p1 TRINITY_DN17265_c0_g1~~TRINITY_DN17265_c0_g1_i1.p1  ORF type:complete len:623 (-),score=90.87 TRINITY_DN17265_c0_g1_i1:19-1887(-)
MGPSSIWSESQGDIDLGFSNNQINLLDSGACGAFIHGIEDEFQEVRYASIDSICELSMRSGEFAIRAVEFLVDMFGDEIDEVRINSINSLRKISSKVQLREEQLHIVLAILEDSSRTIRHPVHNLLSSISLSNAQCVYATIHALLVNLQRYPEDLYSIFSCFKNIGANHKSFTEFLVEDLLRIDPKFLSTEPNVDDQAYIGILIVISNAAVANLNIIPLLPTFTFRHHKYLKDLYPSYFPASLESSSVIDPIKLNLQLLSIVVPPESQEGEGQEEGDFAKFFDESLALLEQTIELDRTNTDHALTALKKSARDLKRLASLDQSLQAKASFYSLYFECNSIILQLKRQQLGRRSNEMVGRLMTLTYELQHKFIGLDSSVPLHFMELRLFGHLIFLLSPSCSSSPDAIKLFVRRTKLTKRFCDENQLPLTQEVAVLDSISDFLSRLDSLDALTSSQLLQTFQNYRPKSIHMDSLLKKSSANIQLRGKWSEDHPAEFLSCLPLRLDLDGSLSNVTDLSSILIQCKFPNKTVKLLSLSPIDFTPIKPLRYSLNSTLSIQSSRLRAWTEQSSLAITVVKRYRPDLPEFDVQGLQEEGCLVKSEFAVVPISQDYPLHILPRSSVRKLK